MSINTMCVCLAQARKVRGGILSRTGHAEGAEIFVTSDFTFSFRLLASYFVQRHSMPGACTRSVESPCVPYDICRLGGVIA